jgi:hypothetical protein
MIDLYASSVADKHLGMCPQACRNSDALLAPESQSFLANIVAGFPHSRVWNDLAIGCGTRRLHLIGENVSGDDYRPFEMLPSPLA